MKILVCTNEYYPVGSGIANVVYNLKNALGEFEHDVKVLSPTGPDIQVGNWKLFERFGGLGLIWFWKKTAQYIQDNYEKYDLIWMHNPLINAHLPWNTIVATVHTTYSSFVKDMQKGQTGFFEKKYYQFMKSYEKNCFRSIPKGAHVTSASKRIFNELIASKVKTRNFHFIENGAETERFVPPVNKNVLRDKYRLPKDKLIIVFAGRFHIQNRPMESLRIFNSLRKMNNSAAFLMLGDGPLLQKTKELARALGIKDVYFKGRVPYKRFPEYLGLSDFYFHNSFYTGQPLALLEAMSCGLPPIVSHIPVFRKIVEDSGCGIVMPNDFLASARAIDDYIKRYKAAFDSQSARKYITLKYSWKNIAREYVILFNKVLKRSSE